MHQSRRSFRIVLRMILFVTVACCVACRRAVSKAPIIERYKAAACISFSANPTVTPHTREWDTPLTLSDGSKVIVSGTQSPGGRINMRYLTKGRGSLVADAGDYVYPSDIRFNNQKDLLYVKASGLAGGVIEETWLFEYDLRAQRQVLRQRVVNGALPAECPEHPQTK
jgi:hypothetical protein